MNARQPTNKNQKVTSARSALVQAPQYIESIMIDVGRLAYQCVAGCALVLYESINPTPDVSMTKEAIA